MLKYSDIKNRPNVFNSFTGYRIEEFLKLLPSFAEAYKESVLEKDKKRKSPRKRCLGGGRKAIINTIEDKFLFILFYFKFYPIQEVLGYFFGISQAQANEWIHRLTPVLNSALGYERELPERKTSNVEKILAECPSLEFIIDGTERPIQRPKDKEGQKKYYSGKKKRHTIKNIVITEKNTKKVKFLSNTYEGKRHDKSIADEENYDFPRESKVWKDTGFQGYEPPDVITFQPKKKPKGKELTPEEKEQNRSISKERIGIENSIGGVKIYHIVRDIFRNHRENYNDLVMETACALYNFKVESRLKAA